MFEALSHPINVEEILRKRKTLKEELLNSVENRQQIKIAVLGGSTTSEFVEILDLFSLNRGFDVTFYESEYNKYYEEAIFENSKLSDFKPDIIYLHTTNQNISSYPDLSYGPDQINDLVDKELEKFKSIWEELMRYDSMVIQNNFELPQRRVLGNLDSYDIHGSINFINRLNSEFAKEAVLNKSLVLNDINYISAQVGLSTWFNKNLWYLAKYAISFEAMPHLALNLTNIISSIYGKTKKCLVLDLDNTLWGGVIGDDGLEGIKIGSETAASEAFLDFQKSIKEIKERGITLAVSSKNDFDNAKLGFDHPDSILKVDDFTSFKANWEPKNINILNIAKEINIGTDSLVFIDDNPSERELVSSQLEEISVPNIGTDVSNFIEHVDRNGYFETTSLSEEDVQRSKYYSENIKRSKETSKFKNYEDFLVSLEMEAEIKEFSSIYLDRITQLTNKTNQFNLTTKRYSISEMDKVFSSKNYLKLYGKLKDKFGDNGLISVVIGSKKKDILHIDLWLMSCRVLQRGMEFAMLDVLVSKAKKQNLKTIIGYYSRTDKNKMVEKFYNNLGFTLLEESENTSKWSLKVETYSPLKYSIRLVNKK